MSKVIGIEWNVGDKCYTGDRIAQCTFVGAMAGGVNCVLKDYDDCVLIVPIAELERVVDKEREHGVYDMCSAIDNHTEDAHFWAGRFYDAGYRK